MIFEKRVNHGPTDPWTDAGPVTGGDTRDFVTGPRGIGGPRRFENTQKRENMRTKIRGYTLLRGPLEPPWDPRGPRAYKNATHGPL